MAREVGWFWAIGETDINRGLRDRGLDASDVISIIPFNDTSHNYTVFFREKEVPDAPGK